MPEEKTYPVIDEGVYQAVIADVESGKQKPYDSRFDASAPDTEPFYVFKFKILTPGPAQGRLLWSKRGKACLPVPPEGKQKPSIVWRIASAVTGHPLSFDEGKVWTLKDINGLAGKQIILIVERTTKQDGGEMNVINTYMHAREVLTDVDEEHGGAETKPSRPTSMTSQSGPVLGPSSEPARYASVPPEFRPKGDPLAGDSARV